MTEVFFFKMLISARTYGLDSRPDLVPASLQRGEYYGQIFIGMFFPFKSVFYKREKIMLRYTCILLPDHLRAWIVY